MNGTLRDSTSNAERVVSSTIEKDFCCSVWQGGPDSGQSKVEYLERKVCGRELSASPIENYRKIDGGQNSTVW